MVYPLEHSLMVILYIDYGILDISLIVHIGLQYDGFY